MVSQIIIWPSNSIIEGTLISEGEKHKTFLLIFTSYFLSFFLLS